MTKRIPISRAKTNFSATVREAESGKILLITRHGKPVAALVSARDARQIQRLRSAGLEGGPASVAGDWKGTDELVEHIAESARVGSRPVPDLNDTRF